MGSKRGVGDRGTGGSGGLTEPLWKIVLLFAFSGLVVGGGMVLAGKATAQQALVAAGVAMVFLLVVVLLAELSSWSSRVATRVRVAAEAWTPPVRRWEGAVLATAISAGWILNAARSGGSGWSLLAAVMVGSFAYLSLVPAADGNSRVSGWLMWVVLALVPLAAVSALAFPAAVPATPWAYLPLSVAAVPSVAYAVRAVAGRPLGPKGDA